MFIQLPKTGSNLNDKIPSGNLPAEYQTNSKSKSKQMIQFSQRVVDCKINIAGVNIFICGGTEEKSMFMIHFEPSLQVQNSETKLTINKSIMKYGTLLFNISDFTKQNLNGVFDEFSKFNNESNFELLLVARS